MDATGATFSASSNEFECPICLGPSTEHKIMLCGHITCRVCLLTWIRAQDQKVGCPMCRHSVFELLILDIADDFVVLLVDSLPSDQVVRATALDKIDVTPDKCSGCEDLLCRSHSFLHPECPGQDVQNTEADARAAVKDLSDKEQAMMETSDNLQKNLKDMEDEFRGLLDMNKIEEMVQVLTFVCQWVQDSGRKTSHCRLDAPCSISYSACETAINSWLPS